MKNKKQKQKHKKQMAQSSGANKDGDLHFDARE